MSKWKKKKKKKKNWKFLNYIEHLFILISTVTGCVSISAFDAFVGIFIGVTSSAVELTVNGNEITSVAVL